MENSSAAERRRALRGQTVGEAQLWVQAAADDWQKDNWQKYVVEVSDVSPGGAGLLVGEPLTAGQNVLLEGAGIPPGPDGAKTRGSVVWCSRIGGGRYRVGIALEKEPEAATREEEPAKIADPVTQGEDLYEILEVNPTASADTVHKVYRMLALRLHPDNRDSGNEEAFKRLLHAYKVLSDPERRASYDAERKRTMANTWAIFDTGSAVPGLEQERKKRSAILAALYTKRLRQPEQAAIPLPELERLLGVPREHLEFPLWFMKEQGWIVRSDNAKFFITAQGVEFAESTGAWQPPMAASARLIEAGR